MQNVAKKERSSNLELFRIITMLLIVAHHYVVNSGLADVGGPIYSNLWSVKSVLLLIFGAWGKMGINCFVFITGYFMCKSQITAKKFAKLLFEVELYKIAIYVIFVLAGYSSFSLAGIVNAVFPFASIARNFTGCFLVFFLLIPFLNVLVKNLTEKQHIRLLMLLGFVYIVLGTLPITGVTFNYVTWFSVLYVVSAYVRLYPKKLFDKTLLWGVFALLSLAVSVFSVVVLSYIEAKYSKGSVYMLLTDSNKVLAFATAFCLFMFFKNVNIKNSKFINTVAASCFGVLLIHANSDEMRQWLWGDLLKNVEMYSSNYLVLHAVVSVIGIYAVCTLIDFLRIQFVEKPFFKLWDKHWEKFSSWFSKLENAVCEKLKIDIK